MDALDTMTSRISTSSILRPLHTALCMTHNRPRTPGTPEYPHSMDGRQRALVCIGIPSCEHSTRLSSAVPSHWSTPSAAWRLPRRAGGVFGYGWRGVVCLVDVLAVDVLSAGCECAAVFAAGVSLFESVELDFCNEDLNEYSGICCGRGGERNLILVDVDRLRT